MPLREGQHPNLRSAERGRHSDGYVWIFIVGLVTTMAVAQSCFSTKRNLDSKRPHIPFTQPTDSLAVINHTDDIYTDYSDTPSLTEE